MRFILVIECLLLPLVPFVRSQQQHLDITTVDSTVASSLEVQYNCIFENLWTRERHPNGFPTDAVHWTRQVLTSHDSTYTMWKEGTLANNAVKQMAEGGGTADILATLEDLKYSFQLGYSKWVSMNNPLMEFNDAIQMSPTNKYISVISKMAPSPDWFSGFHNFNAVNEETKTWYEKIMIETYPYDAGTEDGDTYTTVNTPTNPQQPIREFTDGSIYDRADGTILPVAKYTCTLNSYSSSIYDIEVAFSTVPSSQTVDYNCVFENQWTRARHPNGFPPMDSTTNFHWTKQILASHNDSYSMWKEGEMASYGVEKMAEAGGTATILKRLQDNDDSFDIGYDKYLYALDPKVIYEPLTMTSSRRYLSAISKLAPSPDWFSGFHDFNAVDFNRNTWFSKFTIPVYPFDAGTEDGDGYNTANSATIPPEKISEFTINDKGSIFLNPQGDGILPVATYTCTLDPTTTILTTTTTTTESSPQQQQQQPPDTNNSMVAGFTIGIIFGVFIIGILSYMSLCNSKRTKPRHGEVVPESSGIV